jgi:hypothetical protein
MPQRWPKGYWSMTQTIILEVLSSGLPTKKAELFRVVFPPLLSGKLSPYGEHLGGAVWAPGAAGRRIKRLFGEPAMKGCSNYSGVSHRARCN